MRDIAYYMQWTEWTRNRTPVLRQSPDGPAVVLGINAYRGSRGHYFVGFPEQGVGRWVDANIVNTWPEMSDVDFPVWDREEHDRRVLAGEQR